MTTPENRVGLAPDALSELNGTEGRQLEEWQFSPLIRTRLLLFRPDWWRVALPAEEEIRGALEGSVAATFLRDDETAIPERSALVEVRMGEIHGAMVALRARYPYGPYRRISAPDLLRIYASPDTSFTAGGRFHVDEFAHVLGDRPEGSPHMERLQYSPDLLMFGKLPEDSPGRLRPKDHDRLLELICLEHVGVYLPPQADPVRVDRPKLSGPDHVARMTLYAMLVRDRDRRHDLLQRLGGALEDRFVQPRLLRPTEAINPIVLDDIRANYGQDLKAYANLILLMGLRPPRQDEGINAIWADARRELALGALRGVSYYGSLRTVYEESGAKIPALDTLFSTLLYGRDDRADAPGV